jgi:SHAQKYF class myb-like DNA-binding protein
LFLQGLKKHGKGDWKSISRNFVISRTPSQVASHAQKYYIKLNSENKKRRRPSILDITSVDNGEAWAEQGTVTGTNGQAALPGNSLKQPAAFLSFSLTTDRGAALVSRCLIGCSLHFVIANS